ncbi:hypothetical protein [Oceanobacter mangrovi]|uniref:hypothetical protein n=1 Tax=Oceanobacter mangrovi TaxID=2862510 RepID=UPI001C8EFD38|nr:hypothetical protein [Oceanobacter mangrovi]
MADFKSFLDIGLSKADKAAENIKEIHAVLDDLNRQIKEATTGTVSIGITQGTKEKDMFQVIISQGIGSRYINTTFLSAFNDEVGTEKELAEFKISDDGYPCKISIGEITKSYQDKESLIEGLEELLSTTRVGKAIREVMLSDDKDD